MLSQKQQLNFDHVVANWLREYLWSSNRVHIKTVYAEGKKLGYTRAQIKAARAWYGSQVNTEDGHWWWCR